MAELAADKRVRMVGLGGLRVCEVGMFCWINLGGWMWLHRVRVLRLGELLM